MSAKMHKMLSELKNTEPAVLGPLCSEIVISRSSESFERPTVYHEYIQEEGAKRRRTIFIPRQPTG